MKDLLTVEEAARLLRYSPTTVRAYCRSGVLPAFRVRGEWRIRTADLFAAVRAS